MHSVRARQVQGVNRISRLHGLRGRDVFHSIRGLSKFDVYSLSVKLQLACGELRFNELHLLCGLF